MQYEIEGGAFPVVVCHLEAGEQMKTEKGSMVWMDPCVTMETTGGGVGKMFSKMFSGESMFQNIYTASSAGLIAFGSSFPGKILPIQSSLARASSPRRCRFSPRRWALICRSSSIRR